MDCVDGWSLFHWMKCLSWIENQGDFKKHCNHDYQTNRMRIDEIVIPS